MRDLRGLNWFVGTARLGKLIETGYTNVHAQGDAAKAQRGRCFDDRIDMMWTVKGNAPRRVGSCRGWAKRPCLLLRPSWIPTLTIWRKEREDERDDVPVVYFR